MDGQPVHFIRIVMERDLRLLLLKLEATYLEVTQRRIGQVRLEFFQFHI